MSKSELDPVVRGLVSLNNPELVTDRSTTVVERLKEFAGSIGKLCVDTLRSASDGIENARKVGEDSVSDERGSFRYFGLGEQADQEQAFRSRPQS